MSAILFSSFVKASIEKDINTLVDLTLDLVSGVDLIDSRKVLAKFGIDLVESKVDSNMYEALLSVNDTLHDLRVTIYIYPKQRSLTEKLFLVYHMLAHYLLDVQLNLLEQNQDIYSITETSSPLLDRYYKEDKVNNEYLKDMFAEKLLLTDSLVNYYLNLNIDSETICKQTMLEKEFIELRLKRKVDPNSNLNPNLKTGVQATNSKGASYKQRPTPTILDLTSNKGSLYKKEQISQAKTTSLHTKNTTDQSAKNHDIEVKPNYINTLMKSNVADSYTRTQNMIPQAVSEHLYTKIEKKDLGTKTRSEDTEKASKNMGQNAFFTVSPSTSKGLQMLRNISQKILDQESKKSNK